MTRVVLLDFFDLANRDHFIDPIYELFNKMKTKLTIARRSNRLWLENRIEIKEGYIPIEFYKDSEYVLQSIKKNSKMLLYTHQKCFNNRQVLFESLKAIKKDEYASISMISKKIIEPFTKDIEILKLLIELDPNSWGKEFVKDREMALLAYIGNPSYYKEIGKEVREDEDFILSAIKSNHNIFEYLDDKLQMDRVFIRKALETNGKVFNLLPKEFARDKEFINIVIDQDPMIFEQQVDLQLDLDSAMLAVKKNGMVLEFLPQHYENYDEICREAIKQNAEVFHSASDNVQGDRDLVMQVVRKDGSLFCYASEELRHDHAFIQEVIQNYGFSDPDDGHNDIREIMILTMKKLGYCAKVPIIAFEDIDREFALEVVKKCSDSVTHFPERLMSDREVLMTAFDNSKNSAKRKLICEGIDIDDKDLIFEIFVKYSAPSMIRMLNSMDDLELLKKMIQHNGYAFSLMNETFKKSPMLIEEAWKQCGFVENPSEEFYVKRMNYAYPELL